jgi:hypothetical protein
MDAISAAYIYKNQISQDVPYPQVINIDTLIDVTACIVESPPTT